MPTVDFSALHSLNRATAQSQSLRLCQSRGLTWRRAHCQVAQTRGPTSPALQLAASPTWGKLSDRNLPANQTCLRQHPRSRRNCAQRQPNNEIFHRLKSVTQTKEIGMLLVSTHCSDTRASTQGTRLALASNGGTPPQTPAARDSQSQTFCFSNLGGEGSSPQRHLVPSRDGDEAF